MLEMKKYVIQLDTELKVSKHYTNKLYKHTVQGRSEGTSSALFEVSTLSTSALRYFGFDHFGRLGSKIGEIQVRLW